MTSTGTAREGTTSRRQIVVGVDGSEGSRLALAWAVRLAERLGVGVRAVTAWHYVPQPAGPGMMPLTMTPEDEREALATAAGLVLADFLDGPVPVEHVVVQGHPRHVLVDAAAGQLALVVGSRGHGVVAGALLGSVSQGCATHATCPVVVVPASATALP